MTTHLRKVSSDELFYIVLTYDYHSKYHQYPLRDRKLKAEREVFGSEMKGYEDSHPKLKDAIEEYLGLQYDYKRDLIDVYLTKIDKLQAQLLKAEVTKTKGILDNIEALNKAIEKTQNEINRDEDAEELKGGGELSFIEKWQNNMKDRKRKQKVAQEVENELQAPN